MPNPSPEAFAFLASRRSHPAKVFAGPVPDRAELLEILRAATRVPDHGKLMVVVLSSPKSSEKVPVEEQILSAGALCLGIVNAAEAAGWGANWLSGWPAHDRGFITEAFGAAPQETVAGIIHIGTPPAQEAPDRPRPDLARLITWAD